MLLILMYHRVAPPELGLGNPPAVLAAHLATLRDRANVVLPGEPLLPRRLNVCLTFDDAYADFYFRALPLLREYGMRAVLAVPTQYILDETTVPPETRLAVHQAAAMSGETFREQAPFCTWAELREMQASGIVQIASHSHSHPDMRRPDTDVDFECRHSRELLETKLGRPVDTFIYPYGSVNARAHQAVTRHYAYGLRVGAALNHTWQPQNQPLSRVGADHLPDLATRLSWPSLTGFGLKMLGNQFRAGMGKWR
jgi:peptidoglycan/xylan/chitin deacetylase (PgdA/CDA1 family)